MSAVTAPLAGLPPITAPQQPVETIRTLLRREVAAILHETLPDLAMVPLDKVYDRVMGDPVLLDQAFRVLRQQPELFRQVITTPERAFPQNDDEPLWCGRTLNEAIALVVRACARRYFHQKMRAPRKVAAPAARPVGFWQELGIAVGLVEPPKVKPRRRMPGAGDKLYAAMRDMLRYEWQVPLIPAYSNLSPALVSHLGEKLLDYRDPLKVQLLADHSTGSALMEGRTPLVLSSAERLLANSGDTLNADLLWTVCQKLRLNALFPQFDTNEMRRAVAMVASTSPQALKHLMPVLGEDIRIFTLYLFTAYATLGGARYRQMLGTQSQTWVLEAMARRVESEPPLTGTHEQMMVTIRSWLDATVDSVLGDEIQQTDMMDALDLIGASPARAAF